MMAVDLHFHNGEKALGLPVQGQCLPRVRGLSPFASLRTRCKIRPKNGPKISFQAGTTPVLGLRLLPQRGQRSDRIP